METQIRNLRRVQKFNDEFWEVDVNDIGMSKQKLRVSEVGKKIVRWPMILIHRYSEHDCICENTFSKAAAYSWDIRNHKGFINNSPRDFDQFIEVTYYQILN
ncbi:MAG: hypothetical protein Q8N88_01290 [Nanoarchaeota archaeon]|nr:hypothetical protein [Nanoarchaeota archaeon]